MTRAHAFSLAAELLRSRRDELAQRVSDRCFAELDSYKSGDFPRAESVGTVARLLDFLVRALESGHAEHAVEQGSSLHDEIISFEEGIAARRVKLAIGFEDLIRGLQFMRVEVWATLSRAAGKLDGSGTLALEERINGIFDAYFLGLSSSYRTSQSAVVQHQQKALDAWEEVVKSASEIHLKIPCSTEFAAVVRVQAEAISRRLRFSEEEVYDIITAVGEVCDNAIEHGVSEKGIDVEYTLTGEQFCVDVRDYGAGFDPTGKGEEPPDLFAEDGRGIFLMNNLMDHVEIDSAPGKGTRIVMRKARPRA